MNIHLHIANVNVTVHDDKHLHQIADILQLHTKKLNQLIMTNEEAIAKLDAQATQLAKIQTEVQSLIDAATNQGNVSPELEAAINRVQAAIQTVDDQNADAPTGGGEETQP